VWTLWTLTTANQSRLFHLLVGGAELGPRDALVSAAAHTIPLALGAPLATAAARRFRLRQERWRLNALVHVAAALAFGVVTSAAAFWLRLAFGQPAGPPAATVLPFAIFLFDANAFTYAVVVAVTHAVDDSHWYVERTARAAKLERGLAAARLRALTMQLLPHFLFNTLNTISELLHHDPVRADEAVGQLGALLRETLDLGERRTVRLDEELRLLRAYLDIRHVRFADRLSYDADVDADVLDARVPPFLLQPLVENAIQHGISRRPEGGTVWVSAVRSGRDVHITVADDGVGPASAGRAARDAEGHGIRDTRARLEQLFGHSTRVTLAAREGGAVVTLLLPCIAAPLEWTGEYRTGLAAGV
jgi:two-component sensor histidine kinase